MQKESPCDILQVKEIEKSKFVEELSRCHSCGEALKRSLEGFDGEKRNTMFDAEEYLQKLKRAE